MYLPTYVQSQRLEYQVRASFSSPELADAAARLLPELLHLTCSLLNSEADLARLGDTLQPILMALPAWFPIKGGEPLFDLAPLALAASRAGDLDGLLRQFLPGREAALMQGLLARAKTADQPFSSVSECYRAVLDARDDACARAIIASLGSAAQTTERNLTAIIAGARVWCYIEHEPDGACHLTLELREPDPNGLPSREVFEDACAVNQLLMRHALGTLTSC